MTRKSISRLLLAALVGLLAWACNLMESAPKQPDTLTLLLNDSLKASNRKYDSLRIKVTAGGITTLVFHGPYNNAIQLVNLPVGNPPGGNFTVELIGYRDGDTVLVLRLPFNQGSPGASQVIVPAVPLDTPKVAITWPPDGYLTNRDSVEIQWTVDSVPQPPIFKHLNAEGANVILQTDTSSRGAMGKDSVTVVLDTTPPVEPAVMVQAMSPTNNRSPVWTWQSGGGGIGTFRYKLDTTDLSGDTVGLLDTVYTPASDLFDGQHTLYVQERDAAGNWSLSGTAGVFIDATPPTAPVVYVTPASPTANPRPTWSWISNGDGDGNFRYKLDDSDLTVGATVTLFTNFAPVSDLNDGVHFLFVQERDAAGNWSASGSDSIEIYSPVFAVGDSGTIVKTIDGGANWTAQASGTTQSLFSAHFANADTGWAAGFNGTIIKTIDGGANWTAQASGTMQTLNSVNFVDANVGWAAGDSGVIVKTIDGGANWAAQTSGTAQPLLSVHFSDANTGWAAGNTGTILNTVDGGSNWAGQTSGSTENLHLHFANANTGWTVGAGTANNEIRKTVNGGANWTLQATINGQQLRSVHFANVDTGWTVGSGGTIRRTVNGSTGTTWTAQTSGTTQQLFSVHFKNANTGWSVGDGGTILKTANAGATWTAQTSGTTQILRSVHFPR